MPEGHRDGVCALAGDLQALELVAVVGFHPGGRVGHELGEVVQHARLVDDQVREFADAHFVVNGTGAADDVRVVGRIRFPEGHLRDAVGLGDDPLGEAEGLERLHAARLDAVRLANSEPAGAALDDAGGDIGEHGQLGGGEHSGRTGTHDEHVHFLGELVGAVEAHAGGGLDSRVSGYVSVVVELHGLFLTSLWPIIGTCSISEHMIR